MGQSRVCRNIEITRNQNELKFNLHINYISNNTSGKLTYNFEQQNIHVFICFCCKTRGKQKAKVYCCV